MMQWLLGLGILGMFFFIIVMVAIPLLASLFWITMLVDCAARKFKNKNDKIVWILIVIFTHVIGAIMYYMVIKRKKP